MALFTKGEHHKEVNKASLNTKLMYTYNPNPKPAIERQNVRRKDILLTWEKMSNGQYKFHLKWYQNNKTQQTGAILHLDHSIGEYDAMTRIHDVQFKSRGIFGSKHSLKTLDDLKAEMDKE